jgi:hypothetical protein
MRKGFNGLAALAEKVLAHDPTHAARLMILRPTSPLAAAGRPHSRR